MASSSTPKEAAKMAKIALARQQPLSCNAKLKPAIQNLARAIAHSERAKRYNDSSTLQKQLQAIMDCDKSAARVTIEAAKHSMPWCERNTVEALLAEKEFSYTILRLEEVFRDEPSDSTGKVHLSELKALRISYAQQFPRAGDAYRGWIEMD